MLRSAVCKSISASRIQAASIQACSRSFSVSAILMAKPVVPAPKIKSKVRLGGGPKKEKAAKSGMTHHDFKDAVRTLKFETYAKDVSHLNIPKLSSKEFSNLKDQIVSYDKEIDQHIELMGGYKKFQHHELFREHYSMVSDNTVKINDTLVERLEGPSSSNRVYLSGSKGMGKSTLISQAQALAHSKYNGDVVLLHIEEPELFVKGYSDYVFNPTLNKFHQPMFTKRWIKRLRVVNEKVFEKMPLLKDVSFSNRLSSFQYKKGENNLQEYLLNCHDFGVLGPTDAFQFFLEHLKAYSDKFPVLFSVDNANAIFEKPFTKYFHKDMKPIHYSEFEIGHLIRSLMGGELAFSKGGVLLAHSTDFGESKTLRVGLNLETLDPYAEDLDHEEAANMLKNGGLIDMSLVSLNKDQARKLMEFWKECGVVHTRDYPTKPTYSRAEDITAGARMYKVGEFVNEMDQNEMYEKNLQKTFFISGGNPGVFLKNNVLRY